LQTSTAPQLGEDIKDKVVTRMVKHLTSPPPATPEAQQWSGWGTALKPALEPITMARKPFSSTVAANVIQYGTGAINVDGCRVGTETRLNQSAGNKNLEHRTTVTPVSSHNETDGRECVGRWPANIIHDGSNEAALSLKSGARFFYTAKAGKVDRESENNHPTVKPTMLMAYLCRLITQPGGTILDPFMGSGSTGKAATINGFRFIGIERDPEYHKISEARISNQHEGRLF
jgi:site-specific DNA-methyltransferase (adenine-specific)